MRAPDSPIPASATWTRAAKDMVGASLGTARLWLTLGEGMLTEVFYPRIDIPQIKELNFIIADGAGFWCDLRGTAGYEIEDPEPGIPALVIYHRHERFTFRLRVCPALNRDAVLVEFVLEGDERLRPYALLTPRLGGNADANRAFVERHGLHVALLAEQGPFGLALMAVDDEGRDGFGAVSVGAIGASDAWQDFARNGRMAWRYDEAGPGAVALAGELPRSGMLALAFSTSGWAAATIARSALARPFEDAWQHHLSLWKEWLAQVVRPGACPAELAPLLERSAMVLKVHKDRTFPGAMVASLATPWGEATASPGGYHLVWVRDLVESATAFFALSHPEEALDVLRYLIATQQPDGHWFQNQWLGGKPFWSGVQLDEAAFPVLLAGLLREHGALGATPVKEMVRAALSFIAREGPVTGQDRWEEDAGINAFTLAVAIAALVEGAQFLEEPEARFALDLADEWNASLEDWTFVTGTELARRFQVPGYYVRVAPAEVLGERNALNQRLLIHNRADAAAPPAAEQVALDFLQLVRYGLRLPDDPHVVASVKVADALLKADTPAGPVWHRYNGDGYGEHADGSPFDGAGIGRGWPLLTGERGHYALAAGEDPLPYLRAMAAMTGRGGLLPEQVWDGEPIPEKGLYPGKPSGSAMPLVWAHAEFIKLAYSRALSRVYDRPAAVARRYQGRRPPLSRVSWSYRYKRRVLPAGLPLRLLLPAAARVHWGVKGWQKIDDMETRASGLGVHYADLPVQDLEPGESVDFTFLWADGRWEGVDYHVAVAAREDGSDRR